MSCLCRYITTPGCICVSCARERGFPEKLYVENRDYTDHIVPPCAECGGLMYAVGQTRCYDCRHQTRRVA